MTLTYTATCLFGLESMLGEEIDALGCRRIETIDGRVTFTGNEYAAAKLNIGLRFAERLYLNAGSFEANSFDELFENVRSVSWEDFIPRDARYPVSGHSIKSSLFSVPDCQRIIKKAVSVRLGKAYSLATLPETGETYKIEFFIFKDRASVMIDLSGSPLHKRGYRPERVTAPLRETLAAAIVKLSRPRENVILRDPFCGSGTIAIEGAMMMKNIAPGIKREFAAEKFPFFPARSWHDARENAKAVVKQNVIFEAIGSDIDSDCVRIATESAYRAGVSDCANFFTEDALKITTGGKRGTIVTNPPYGERLMTPEEAEKLYVDIGVHFKTLDNWQMYVLTPNENFPKLFRRRADKIRRLYNGMIPCYLYQYFKKTY